MALSSKMGSFMITGTLNTQQTIEVGFQPKVIFLWCNGRTDLTDAIGRSDHKRGFGAISRTSDVLTDRRYIASLAQDTPTAMVTNEMQGSAACLGITTTADAIDGLLDIQAIGSTSFTVIIDDAFTANYICQYLALGGSDITDVLVGEFAGVAGATQDITSVGFQPDFVLVFSTGQTTTNNTIRGDSKITIGAATGISNQAVWSGASNDGAANAQTLGYTRSGDILVTYSASVASLENRATFDSFLSNGFRIAWPSQTTTNLVYFYVAIKGGEFLVDSLLTQTDTVTSISESIGFVPSAAMFLSSGKAENSIGTPTDDDTWSLGAFSATNARGAMASSDDDAVGTAVVATAISYDEVYVNINPTDGTLNGEMDIQSIDSGGFTCIMDDADPAQNFVWYVAFGSTPVGGNIVQSVFADDEIQGVLFGGQVVR